MFVIAKKAKVAESKNAYDDTHVYKCLSCGAEHENPTGKFYKSSWSKLWLANDRYCPVCKTCLTEMFDEYSRKYRSDKVAMIICAHYLDVPFYNSLYESINNNNAKFTIGMYLKIVGNNTQYRNKTFQTTLVDGELNKNDKVLTEEREIKWSIDDKKNKARVIRILKYDPFEDASDDQRRFMFNLCSDYLQDEVIIEDPHKLQGVIEIVKTHSQLYRINRQFDNEMDLATANEVKLKSLSSTKKDLMDLINKFAKDNGISASLGNRGQKGSSSLAYHVKNLDEIDFTESKINLYDIQTCEAMRQIADISNSSILQQIHLNADELGDMSEQQVKIIHNLKEQVNNLKEENRLLKINMNMLKSGE